MNTEYRSQAGDNRGVGLRNITVVLSGRSWKSLTCRFANSTGSLVTRYVGSAWWDWILFWWLTNYSTSVLWCCWLGLWPVKLSPGWPILCWWRR